MNPIPPASTNASPDALDRVLSDFFKSELPAQIPMPRIAPVTPASRPSATVTTTLERGRLALAASVALILGSFWYVSSHSPQATAPRPGTSMDSGSAKIPKELRIPADKAGNTRMP